MSSIAVKLFDTVVVASVLSNLPESKKHLTTELRKLHPIFYNLRHECTELMKDIRFDKRGTFVYSQSLDQAFSNLETAKVLPKVNPDLDKYEITSKLRNYYSSRLENKLSDGQKKDAKRIAQKLADIATE